MKIAALQYPFSPDGEEVFSRLLNLYQKCPPVDLVVAPELGLTGYEASFALDFVKEALARLKEEVSQKGLPLLVGATDPEEKKSAAYLFTEKGTFKVAEKINLFPGFDAPKGFRPGRRSLPFRVGEAPVGVLICYDLRFPELAKYLVTRGAKLVFVLAAWPQIRLFHFHQLLRARAIENQVFTVGVNATGSVAGHKLAGQSVVFSPLGEEIALLKDEEGILIIEMDFREISSARQLFVTSRFCPPPTPEEKILPLPRLLPLLEEARALGQQIVFTNGCFDLLHAGHVSYLYRARQEGDLLVVGLNADTSVRRLKGPQRPINPEDLRAKVLAGLSAVDFVVLFEEDTPEALIKAIKPDVLVKGADWPEDKIVGASFVKAYGGRVVRVPFEHPISTTKLLTRIKNEAPSH